MPSAAENKPQAATAGVSAETPKPQMRKKSQLTGVLSWCCLRALTPHGPPTIGMKKNCMLVIADQPAADTMPAQQAASVQHQAGRHKERKGIIASAASTGACTISHHETAAQSMRCISPLYIPDHCTQLRRSLLQQCRCGQEMATSVALQAGPVCLLACLHGLHFGAVTPSC